MLTCKQVARNLTDRDYAELSWLKRLGLRLHVLLCVVCGRYHRQLMRFQDGVRRYRCGSGEPTRKAPVDDELGLRDQERDALRQALAAQTDRSESNGTPGS